MKYKVGDKVVIKNGRVYTVVKVSVIEKGYTVNNGAGGGWIDEDEIDHEKTAELNTRTLEDIVAERNSVTGEKELDRRIKEVNKATGMERYVDMCMDGTISFDDPVNHPSHYKQGGIETLDIIKAVTTGYSGYEGSLVANIVKYLARANFKGAKEEDIKKAQFYMNKLVEEVANDTTQPNTDRSN